MDIIPVDYSSEGLSLQYFMSNDNHTSSVNKKN